MKLIVLSPFDYSLKKKGSVKVIHQDEAQYQYEFIVFKGKNQLYHGPIQTQDEFDYLPDDSEDIVIKCNVYQDQQFMTSFVVPMINQGKKLYISYMNLSYTKETHTLNVAVRTSGIKTNIIYHYYLLNNHQVIQSFLFQNKPEAQFILNDEEWTALGVLCTVSSPIKEHEYLTDTYYEPLKIDAKKGK